MVLIDTLTEKEPIEELLEKEKREILRKHLDRLTQQQQEVLNLKYGLNGGVPMTQTAISIYLGVSRTRIGHIEKKALEELALYIGQDSNL